MVTVILVTQLDKINAGKRQRQTAWKISPEVPRRHASDIRASHWRRRTGPRDSGIERRPMAQFSQLLRV